MKRIKGKLKVGVALRKAGSARKTLPLPLREGVGGRGEAAQVVGFLGAPPNPLPQGEGEYLYFLYLI
jgi:hypothetical protein